VVRNDIYARFSHAAYNKGTALAEIARLLGVAAEEIIAAGDHFNDLPMLSRRHAQWLIAPGNAVPCVKQAVLAAGGFVAEGLHGHGVAEGLAEILRGLSGRSEVDGERRLQIEISKNCGVMNPELPHVRIV
jgi:hydroxymethylpyrimidine pyrophosphatase-like HAD family hydrolase